MRNKILNAVIIFVAIQFTLLPNLFAQERSRSESDSKNTSISEQYRKDQLAILSKRLHSNTPQFSLVGQVLKNGGNKYSINGEQFIVNKKTTIFGNFKVGKSAEVRGFVRPGLTKLATQITVIEKPADSKPGKAIPNETGTQFNPRNYR